MKALLRPIVVRILLFGFFVFVALVSLALPGVGRRFLDDAHRAARNRCKMNPP